MRAGGAEAVLAAGTASAQAQGVTRSTEEPLELDREAREGGARGRSWQAMRLQTGPRKGVDD